MKQSNRHVSIQARPHRFINRVRLFLQQMLVMSCLLLPTICVATLGDQPSTSSKPSASPAPAMVVSLERQIIKQDDMVTVTVWLSNPTDEPLAISLHIASPDFLVWNYTDGAHKKPIDINAATNIGILGAKQGRALKLTVTSAHTISVDDYNVLLSVSYASKNNTIAGVLTSEKQFKVRLFGTDSLGGVPLDLAGFIVPGLFFWLVLTLFKTPWATGVALGDKLIYSVILSMAVALMLMGIGQLFTGIPAVVLFFKDINLSGDISVSELEKLAFFGALFGLIIVPIDRGIRSWRMERVTIHAGDKDVVKLQKALRLNKPYRNRLLKDPQYYQHVKVVAAGGSTLTYVGSFYAESGDFYWLFGGFTISTKNSNSEAVKQLLEKGYYKQILEMAQKNEVVCTGSQDIKEFDDYRKAMIKNIESDDAGTGDFIKHLAKSQYNVVPDEISDNDMAKALNTGGADNKKRSAGIFHLLKCQ